MRQLARTIQPLSDHLINQIAAGEVIERPASVVKELVENSLDAGARRIDVETEQGGLTMISVSDDGHGIPAAELHAALERHWTSKLSSTAGLDRIASLGFRGEALASIAAVADIEITSRTATDEHAWRVTLAAGQTAPAPRPCRAPPGTRVVVRDLFHDVPARRRFLKRARTEYLHVQRLMRRIGFAQPAVAFSLSQPGTRGLTLRPAGGIGSERWKALFGEAFWRAAKYVEVAADGLAVHGWVGGAGLASSQSELQYLALNGRYVRDRQIAHAVRLAFGDRLPPGRFPAYALALDLPLESVDVNVHPGKLEVRIAPARTVHDLVHAVVLRGLGEPADVRAPAPATGAEAEPPDSTGERATGYALPASTRSAAAHAFGRALALVEGRFLIFLGNDGLRGADLREIWRGVIAVRLAASNRGPPPTRPLLFPYRLQADDERAEETMYRALRAYGVGIESIGASSRVLRSVPAILPEVTPEVFGDRLLELIRGGCAPPEAIARAAADAIALGEQDAPANAALQALTRALAAAGTDVSEVTFRIDARALDRLAEHARR